MKGKPVRERTEKQMVFLQAELLPSTSVLLNCSILSTLMQMISIAKLTAE